MQIKNKTVKNIIKGIENVKGENINIETHLIENCGHHIPIQASSIALNYILKNI